MNLTTIVKRVRELSDDLVEPYLTSRAKIVLWANEAENEACRRSRAIIDSTTAAVCDVAFTDGTPTYALDSRVIFVRRVKLEGEAVPLRPVSRKELDQARPGWEDETGQPTHLVRDMDTGLLRPYPTPDGDYTAHMTVIRLPLAEMVEGEDEPEIHARHHWGMLDWILHRVYGVPDSDLYNPKKSEQHLAVFEANFGRRSTAQDEIWIEREHDFDADDGIY